MAGDAAPLSPDDVGSATVDELPVYTGKVCDEPNCAALIPASGEPGFSAARKKCDEHFVGQRSKPKKKRTDQKPIDVNVTLGGPKGKSADDKRVAKVTAGATQMMQTLGVGLMLSGQQKDAEAIINGAEMWGAAIGDLSRYQPWLATIFAPTGEMTGQGLAWLAVVLATAGIVVPVLANHDLVSPALANKVVGGLGAVSGLAESSADADSE